MKKLLLVSAMLTLSPLVNADYNLIYGQDTTVFSMKIDDKTIVSVIPNIVGYKQTLLGLTGPETEMMVEYNCTTNQYKVKSTPAPKWSTIEKAKPETPAWLSGQYACEFVKAK